MRSSLSASILACAVIAGATVAPAPAHAEIGVPSSRSIVPILAWGAAGMVVGGYVVPMIYSSLAAAPAAASGAAVGAAAAPGWGLGMLTSTPAIVGGVIGAVIGYQTTQR